jgi:hypothetical protein
MRLLLALLALLAAIEPAGAQNPPPASRYAQPPFLRGALLSPDGTRVAAQLSDAADVTRIGIWTLAKGADQDPQTISVGGLTGFQWAGNQRLLVTSLSFSIIGSSSGIYIGPNRRVSSHELAGGKSFFLGSPKGAFDDVIFTDPDGRFVLLSSQGNIERSPSVRRVDLATEASVLVQPAVKGVWSWHADARGVVRVGVDYDQRRPRIHYRDHAAAPLRRYVPRLKLTDDSVIDEVRFVTETGPGLIVMNGENGRFGLYEYDFAADVRGAALFQHDEVDVDSMVIGPGGALEGVRYDDDRRASAGSTRTWRSSRRRSTRPLPGAPTRS